VFIPTTAKISGFYGGGGAGTRHYRGGGGSSSGGSSGGGSSGGGSGGGSSGGGSSGGSSGGSGATPSYDVSAIKTKRNKRERYTESIWSKIEADFTPELLEEQERLNIPDIIYHSPKQTAASFISIDDTHDNDGDIKPAPTNVKKLSALFIKPDINVECLYRKSGIRENCEVCASEVVLTDDGFLTCKNPACSILYKDESLDQSAEWRYYGADDNQNNDPTRCGMPVNPLLKESSYGCKVMCEGGSYSQDMMKIRRYTEWQSMPYREKAQYDMFQKITTLAQNKGISKMIIDEALRVHKRISEHKTFRSLNRDGVVGASIYIACKIHNCPRTPKEIASIFNLDNTSATKGCKNAVSIINELECNLDNSEKTNFCKTKPEAFIERYCSRLSINDELTKLCQFIAVMIEKQNLIPENTPHSIASGIIYFVACMCHLPITKRDVNRVSDMSEVTINKCYKKLYDMREKLIPKMILAKYTVPVVAAATATAATTAATATATTL
jgi:transcription initiation factor TFIIB